MEIKTYKKGDIIFRENTWDLNLYLVREGSVGVYLKYDTDQRYQLNEILPGKWFGEMAVFEMRKRSSTAVALEDCRLFCVEGNEFEDWIRLRPDTVIDMYKGLCQNLRRLSKQQDEARAVLNEYLKNEGAHKDSSLGVLNKIMHMITDYYKGTRRWIG